MAFTCQVSQSTCSGFIVIDLFAGIVSLLFCGITLKHYAYYNMSRRTQLSTKFFFQITAQLSENFIFIYLGLTLFTDTNLAFNPWFILVTVAGICIARWLSVFPLSKAINYVCRVRAQRRGQSDAAEELPWNYQAMLFWAGLRGAVGVALAAGIEGNDGPTLRATVLVVVVLTVIIFGGTTARMLEILNIRTGVVEEIDSDDEFDIETANGGTYYKRSGTGFGHTPKPSAINLDFVNSKPNGSAATKRVSRRKMDKGFSSSNRHSPSSEERAKMSRKTSSFSQRERENAAQSGTLLSSHQSSSTPSDDEEAIDDLDLPPAAPRRQESYISQDLASPGPEISSYDGDMGMAATSDGLLPGENPAAGDGGRLGGIRNLLRGAASDHTAWFQQLDEGFIKPHLLLDQHQGQGKGPPPV